jgi:DNA-binding NtrC family response regulator
MKILSYHIANQKHIYYKEIMDEFEKNLITALLKKHDYNVTRVSARIKLHRNTIKKKIQKLNIKEKRQK